MPAPCFSVQRLSLLLSVSLMLITGLITGLLSVTTGNRALDSTTATYQAGLADCFDSGRSNVALVGGLMMNKIVDDANSQIAGFLSTPMLLSEMLLSVASKADPATAKSVDFVNGTMRSILYNAFITNAGQQPRADGFLKGRGVTEMSTTIFLDSVMKQNVLFFLEHPSTVSNPPVEEGGMHLQTVTQNYGELDGSLAYVGTPDAFGHIRDRPLPEAFCTDPANQAPAAPDGGINYSRPQLCTKSPNGKWCAGFQRGAALEAAGGTWGDETANTAVVGWCAIDMMGFAAPEWIMRLIYGKDPNDEIIWGPMLGDRAELLSIFAYGMWSHPDQEPKGILKNKIGIVNTAMDAAALSNFIKLIVADLPPESRMYAVEQSPWDGTIGKLTATSHGDFAHRGRKVVKGMPHLNECDRCVVWPRHVSNATDPVVRGSGKWAMARDGGFPGIDPDQVYVCVPAEVWVCDPSLRWGDAGDYWLKVRVLQLKGGLLYYVVLLIPNDEVMRTIDAATRTLDARIKDAERRMESEKEDGFTVMLVVLLVCVAALIGVSCVFTYFITAPLVLLEAAMASVAAMRLDAADDAGSSRLAEVASMLASFRKMVEQLREYKAYLPQSCLEVQGESDENADDDDDGASDVSVSRLPALRGHAPRRVHPAGAAEGHAAPARRSRMSLRSVQSDAASPRPAPFSPVVARRRPSRRPTGSTIATSIGKASVRPATVRPPDLRKKGASLVAANLPGYLRAARARAPGDLVSFHREMLTALTARAAAGRALTDGVEGDRFNASLNGAKPCTGHRAAAVRLAFGVSAADGAAWGGGVWDALRRALAPANDADAAAAEAVGAVLATSYSFRTAGTAAPAAPPGAAAAEAGAAAGEGLAPAGGVRRIAAGVCSGELLCGALGCEALRRYSFVGPAAAWAHAAERLATRWRCAVLANGTARADAAVDFVFRLRTSAAFAKPSHATLRPQGLWEVVTEHKAQDVDEWMYQLEKTEQTDTWRHYNKAKQAFFAGDWDGAARHAAAGREEAPALSAAFDELDQEVGLRPSHPHAVLDEAHVERPPPQDGDGGADAAMSPREARARKRGAGAAETQQELVEAGRRDEAAAAAIRQADLDKQRAQLDSKKQERAAKKAPAAPALDL